MCVDLNKVGHVYGAQQSYEPSAGRPPFERSSTLHLQPSDGSSGDHTSSPLHARAAHVQPATSDQYRPVSQPSSSSSSMYPKPPSSSPYDRTAAVSAYQPVANDSHSVPQSGYQSYSARPSSLVPQVAHTQIGTEGKPSDPPPTAALYRPKTTNAYDPPIPPPKPSRHISRALGSSRAFPPTGATQAYAAQDMRHVTYYTNPSEALPPNRYTPQGHVPSPAAVSHPPSNASLASLATGASPPHREPQSRIVSGSSTSTEPSIGHSYPVWPQHVPSAAENIPFDQLAHSAVVSRDNEVFTLNRVEAHRSQPGQRGEFPAHPHHQDTSLSGNQYNYVDAGSGFTRQPTTGSSFSTEVVRSLPAPIHTSSHDVPGYTPTLNRVHSPGNSSVHSSRSSRSRDLVSPPAGVVPGSVSYTPVTAEPSTESVMSRVSSPGSNRSWKSPHPPSYDPYAPASNTGPFSSTARDRSMSNSSLVTSRSSTASDRYVPPRHGPYPTEVPASASLHQTSRVPVHDTDRLHGQTLILSPQTHAPYAPSPSLLGSNDPLGRTSSRAPVVSFGFGGKLVLCFHGSNTLNTGFDIALSSRQTTGIQMRPLHAAIPESALDHVSTSFPGPLFCDPGSPTVLVRAAVATQSKNNKVKVIEYLEGRAEEIARGLGYLSQGSPERRQAEGKLILVKLLRVLLEHDGKLSGR